MDDMKLVIEQGILNLRTRRQVAIAFLEEILAAGMHTQVKRLQDAIAHLEAELAEWEGLSALLSQVEDAKKSGNRADMETAARSVQAMQRSMNFVLVSTHETQGQEPWDICNVPEGELVINALCCADPQCPTRRAWGGCLTRELTSTVKIIAWQGSEATLRETYMAGLRLWGWLSPEDGIEHEEESANKMIDELIALVGAMADREGVGTIMERLDWQYRPRRT